MVFNVIVQTFLRHLLDLWLSPLVTRWLSHMEQDLLNYLEHLSSSSVFDGVCIVHVSMFVDVVCLYLFATCLSSYNFYSTLFFIVDNCVIVEHIFIRFQWVSDCCLTFSNFSAVSWREQVNFQWDYQVRFVLDQHAKLDFYSTSSWKQQSAGRHVAPLGHIILIPSQPVFVLST